MNKIEKGDLIKIKEEYKGWIQKAEPSYYVYGIRLLRYPHKDETKRELILQSFNIKEEYCELLTSIFRKYDE